VKRILVFLGARSNNSRKGESTMTNPPSSRELARRRMAQVKAEKEATQKRIESLESEIVAKEQELAAINQQYEEDVNEINSEIAELQAEMAELRNESIPASVEQAIPKKRGRKAATLAKTEPQHEEVIPSLQHDEAPEAKPSLKARAKKVGKFIVGDPKSDGSQRG